MSPLAVIGGSGFTAIPGLEVRSEQRPETPYGPPSAPIVEGTLGGGECLFLPRHGVGHNIPPHRINYRANIWALRSCGAQHIVGLAATGGIASALGPAALVVPDQLIDYTYGRASSFDDLDERDFLHIDFTRPYCAMMRQALRHAAGKAGIDLVDGGTYGVTQGPRLETAAEIARMERDGCDLVGMTGMPEAALAKELGLCYASLAFVVNWAAGKATGEIQMEDIEAAIAACNPRIQRILVALARIDA